MRLRSTTAAMPVPVRSPAARPAQKKKSVSRGAYLVLLAVLAAWGIHAASRPLLFATVPGVVDRGQTTVGSEHAGRIEEIGVAPGRPVTAGTVVARVRLIDEELEAEAAREESRRLEAEIEAERRRASSRASQRGDDLRADAARLLEGAGADRAELSDLDHRAARLEKQLVEVDQELAARRALVAEGIQARSDLFDFKMLALELHGQLDAIAGRQAILRESVRELETAATALRARAARAEDDELEASAVGQLQARLAESEARARRHQVLARAEIVSPLDGTVSWVHARPGELVRPGEPVVEIVPRTTATVVAHPGDDLGLFPVGATVHVDGPDIEARGTVERVLGADRALPTSLLRPYEREVVGPAVVVRLHGPEAAEIRAGSTVRVRRFRLAGLGR